VSREPLSRADACAYVPGTPIRTQSDERLAAALAADVETHRATGTLGIAPPGGGPTRLLEGGASSGGSAVALVPQQSIKGGRLVLSSGAEQAAAAAAAVQAGAGGAGAAARSEVSRPASYGTLAEGPEAGGAEDSAGASVLTPAQQELAEERRRRAQRPETGEDLLDSVADRGSRRSGVTRYGLGKKN
jgi:hypothetical protein